jgi:signal transduction histidine kinase
MRRWEQSSRWVDAHTFTIDVLNIGLLLLFFVVASGEYVGGDGTATWVWAALVIAPLAWRRTRPVASAVAVYAVGLAHLLAGHPLIFPADMAVLLALYSVTVYGPRWAHRTAIGGAMVGSVVLVLALVIQGEGSQVLAMWLLTSVTALAVWAFGLVRRARYETLTALRDRAERLEVERDQQTRLATSAERARIAREMHDIVAHSLSVIVAQADGGRYAAEADPDAAPRSLATIAETGRAALDDMRRLLGVLRVGDDTPSSELIPQPVATDLEQLVEQVRASGMRVSLVRTGTVRALPPGAGMVVYRICQESLTNVLKHAGPDPSVTVLVQWMPSALALEVSDDGRGATAAASDGRGQGLVGMRERAAMFGGSVSAAPRAGGGFRVRVDLPLAAPA